MAQINPYRILSEEEVIKTIGLAKNADARQLGQMFSLYANDMRLDMLVDGEERVEGRLDKVSKALSKQILIEKVVGGREEWQSPLQEQIELPNFSSILHGINHYEPVSSELVKKYLSFSDVNFSPLEVEILKKVSKGEEIEYVPSRLFERGYVQKTKIGRKENMSLTAQGTVAIWVYKKLTEW
jgi:hypothetical protein